MNGTEQARAALRDGCSCAVFQNGALRTSRASGIRPLLAWLEEDPSCFQGAFVADKIVGRAAALLLVHGGLDGSGSVYGEVLSDGAARVLEEYRIPFRCGRRVPHIINRRGDGVCLMEKRVRDIGDPAQAFAALREAAAALQAAQNDQPGPARPETEREL